MNPGSVAPHRLACLLLLLVLNSGFGFAAGAAEPTWDPSRFMSLDEVEPGMRGVGHTVLRGTQLEEFEVEILGVLETSLPGGGMILARLSGAGLEETGVIRGMSGSPVYIDGRLLGAIAFSWPFATEPIGGITPNGAMLGLESRIESAALEPRGGLPFELWESLWFSEDAEALGVLAGARSRAGSGVTPIQTPVSMGGFEPNTFAEAAGLLEDFGFAAVQGGAVGSSSDTSEMGLFPGGPVAVQLVSGDASMAAIGTVTLVEGDRVFAFGHRMMNLGAAAYPMTEASILAVMPSSNASFKIGVPGRTLGAVTGDFNSGILGKLGESPRVIPVEIVLNHLERREELRFEILDARGLTPVLAATVAMNSMESLGRTSGPSTIRTTTEIKLADGRSVSAPSVQAGFSPPIAVAGSVARLVGLLYGNPFEPVNLAGITIEISLGDAIEAAFLEDVSIPSGTHHPGDRLPVTLGLRDFRGVTWKHELDLELPGDLPPGTYRLMACDGAQGRL